MLFQAVLRARTQAARDIAAVPCSSKVAYQPLEITTRASVRRSRFKRFSCGEVALSKIQRSASQSFSYYARPKTTTIIGTSSMASQACEQFQGSSEEELETWLVAHGVKCETYGQRGVKSIKELLTEIRKGECQLEARGGKPVRTLEVLNLLISAASGKVLLEEFQVRPDGAKRRRDLPLSEKLLPGEYWKDAVERAVAEELGSVLCGPPIIDVNESSYRCATEEKTSQSYPGLLSRYKTHKVEAVVGGLPLTDRFVTTEPRPGGVLESHWVWTSGTSVGDREGREVRSANLPP